MAVANGTELNKPFHCVSVNLIQYSEQSSPGPQASPISSSQSLNTTTKSSTVSSTFNDALYGLNQMPVEKNYTQMLAVAPSFSKNFADSSEHASQYAVATISKTRNYSSSREQTSQGYYLNQNTPPESLYCNSSNKTFQSHNLASNGLNKYYL